MRVIVVGLGVQGHKRRQFAGKDYVACVDPLNPEADYKHIEEVPLVSFDAALLCVPDKPKIELISYLITHRKHVLVEKPLWALHDEDIAKLQNLAISKNVFCYTAYNHRFEPHFVRMKELIQSGVLGKIYHCRLFYGNGTARLVRDSLWRDEGAGVLPDLGSHLLDTARFWFGEEACSFKNFNNKSNDFSVVSSHAFENKAPDHVVISNHNTEPSLDMEMTLLSFRNYFTCDIFAENGTAHISSLCKWGPTTFTHRVRVLPSGRPDESSETLVQGDPTWALEYEYFKQACLNGRETNLSNDIWLHQVLKRLSKEAVVITRKSMTSRNQSDAETNCVIESES